MSLLKVHTEETGLSKLFDCEAEISIFTIYFITKGSKFSKNFISDRDTCK